MALIRSAISAKTARIAIFGKKVGKIVESMETCQRAPTRSVISVKNWRNRRVNVNMSKRAPTRSAMFAKTARIAIILKSAKNWKNRRVDVNLSEGIDKVCDFCKNFKNCNYCKICEKLKESSRQ